ncbi:MAG TPA: valine--tRNA ligase [Acidiferrobacter sp.]|nr:valine--tRNA ligase [Acidiferrobacter sp.]
MTTHSPALDKSYEPQEIEETLYAKWEAMGAFAPSGHGPGYCIMIPPPNVTGSLHMGHAFQDTIMDALTRYHRMRGDDTLWQPGTDHAGIATQMVVERQLEAAGTSRAALGREPFLAAVWEWKARSGGRISEQLRRMGASVDWSRERFTLDDGLSLAVREVFVRLYERGLIYRGKRLVNWDPSLETAVSDLEVTAEEEDGFLWHIRYPLANGEGLVVATTRPETLLGDEAIAVHPDDPRYQRLIGQRATLPLTGREIPVIADNYVDPAFGSGCVKITPAHDFNDYEVGLRHDLPLTNILTKTAHIDLPGSPYHGLSREEARVRILADLDRSGLLVQIEPHKLKVPRGERTRAIIEPWLTDQWYVRTETLARPAVQAVEDGRVRFVPDNWAKTYFEWMRNIKDWCISRQIWWGHRIPAWYDEAGNVYVAHSEDEVRARHHLSKETHLRQDPDVLDTWFSSALWPFSTLGWPQSNAEMSRFYPTSVLVTGFDIIFFWVARMIMMGLEFTGEVPFREVYVHGLVLDAKGQKMSKSRGNVIDPLDLIDGISLKDLVAKRTSGLMQPAKAKEIQKATEQEYPKGITSYGTDALRMTFASLATQARNINFDLGRVDGYRNFCNKLWNAARFVLINTADKDCGNDGPYTLDVGDRWIVSRLQQTEQAVELAFASYRFDLASQALYSFIWDEYCSWYLEWSKTVLADAEPASARGTRRTLLRVLETALRLLHPLMPFITEALWQKIAPLCDRAGPTIMLAPYPKSDPSRIDDEAIADMDGLMGLISAVRTIRGEMNIAPSLRIPILIEGAENSAALLKTNEPTIIGLTRAASVTVLALGHDAPESAVALVGSWRVLVPLKGLIDKAAELQRLGKEIDKTEREISRAQAKLGRPDFIERAPPAVVQEEHRRLEDFQDRLQQLGDQQTRIARLAD